MKKWTNIKKSIFSIEVLILLLCYSTVAFAYGGDIKIFIDGDELEVSQSPVIANDTTLVPMREIFEALNVEVVWVNETKQIIATDTNNCIILTMDSTVAQKNGVDVNLSVAPKIVNGLTYVPVRFIAEALNADVIWDNDSRTVIINSSNEEENQAITFSDYVLYSTSSLETLAREVLNGNVVYFDGQYWATPEFASMMANAEVAYMNDISAGTDIETNDRQSLADLDLNDVFQKTEWIEEDSIFLGDLRFTYSVLVKDGEIVRAGYFYRNITKERVHTLWDMTKEFAEAQEAESEFNGINIKKVEGKYYFFKKDLIKNNIIKENI